MFVWVYVFIVIIIIIILCWGSTYIPSSKLDEV